MVSIITEFVRKALSHSVKNQLATQHRKYNKRRTRILTAGQLESGTCSAIITSSTAQTRILKPRSNLIARLYPSLMFYLNIMAHVLQIPPQNHEDWNYQFHWKAVESWDTGSAYNPNKAECQNNSNFELAPNASTTLEPIETEERRVPIQNLLPFSTLSINTTTIISHSPFTFTLFVRSLKDKPYCLTYLPRSASLWQPSILNI